MATIDIKDAMGQVSGSAELADSVFGIEPNVPVMHQVVRAQRASWRQGTSNTLTRGNVSGGGKKPFRQKGTGNARQGTSRAPQMPGGGIVFGPHPRSYEIRINNKEVKLAMRSALSAKLADGEFVVVNEFGWEKPSTKAASETLKALGLAGKRVTVLVGDDDLEAFLSFRNIKKVTVMPVSFMSTYDFLDNKALVVTSEALARIEEVLA